MPKISSEKPMNKKQQREAKRAKATVPAERPVIYPEVQVQLCAGESALTADRAKQLLGWEEETEEKKFGSDYQMTTYAGVKVRTSNNTRNRPWERSLALAYAQNMLRKRWRLNGETVTADQTGEVTSGQHRLSGLVMAEQIRVAHPEQWEDEWPEPVTIPTILVLGTSGDDDTVNTLDTGRPRSVGDILYRSHHFAKYPSNERKKICRVAEYAIRLVWSRTGASKDAYAPISTKAECLAFLDNHKALKACIEHVYTEDKEGTISKYISPGTAAGLCYLMAASKSDGAAYRDRARDSGVRQEKGLDLTMQDKAEEFWLLLGSVGNDDLKALRHAIGRLSDPETGRPTRSRRHATMAEKIALVILAWQTFVEKGKVTSHDLKLSYKVVDADEGIKTLTGTYEIGGIDSGEADEDDDDADDDDDDVVPTPEEIEAAAEKIRKSAAKQEREDKKAAMASASAPPSMTDSAKAYRDNYGRLCEQNPGKIIFVQARDSGNYTTIDGDAITCAKQLEGYEVKTRKDGLKCLTIPKDEAKAVFDTLVKADLQVAVAVEKVSGMKQKTTEVKDWTVE